MTIKLAGIREVVTNSAASGATPVAATETVLAGSQIVLPSALKVGDRFKWRVSMTKTAAGTGTSAFKVKSDKTAVIAAASTTVLTLTFPTAETAAVGSALVDIEAIVTAISATAGASIGSLIAVSTATAATGFSNQEVGAVATTLDTSSDIESVGLTIVTGAADVVTVNYVSAEYISAEA